MDRMNRMFQDKQDVSGWTLKIKRIPKCLSDMHLRFTVP